MASSGRKTFRRSARSLVAVLLLAGCAVHDPSADDASVRAVLGQQVDAWNNGDIPGYMQGYWRSDSTIFISGGTRVTGYDTVLARFQRSYPTRDAMGHLTFEELEILMTSSDAALARGIWRLRRSEDEPWGRFTLLLGKKADGWRIVYDHTSSGS